MVPNPRQDLAFAVHAELQTKNGIFNHENLVFDELIADKKYQFVYIFTPVADQRRDRLGGLPDRDRLSRSSPSCTNATRRVHKEPAIFVARITTLAQALARRADSEPLRLGKFPS